MMTREIILRGSDQPVSPTWELSAGGWTATLTQGELRRIRWHGVEVLQRIYCALRDANWETIPGAIDALDVKHNDDGFSVHFVSRHQRGEIGFEWRGAVEASAGGVLSFAMDGVALTSFQRNRIGFCVLHGSADCAGRECIVRHSDGREEGTGFPIHVAPHQPFLDVRALRHQAAPGLSVDVEFEGDEFETEDQRNWTDSSFKTYSTPLRLPYPAPIEAGSRLSQRVTLRVLGVPLQAVHRSRDVITVELDATQRTQLPAIGIEFAAHGEIPTALELARLKALGLQHLRVSVDLRQPAWQPYLARSIQLSRALALPLEVALQGISPKGHLAHALLQCLESSDVQICRWLLHDPPSDASQEMFPRIALFAGTDANFAELNRLRPTGSGWAGVCFSLNPQVHASDDEMLMQNLLAQGEAVRSARAFFPGEVAISTVTLKARFNAVATNANSQTAIDELPSQVDVRQMSLFGAAWTLGSLQACAAAGANSITYFETTGWRGVMERELGSLVPGLFPSIPGAVFPLYHVLADVAEFAGGTVVGTRCGEESAIAALALEHGARRRIMLANFTPQVQRVRVAWTGPSALIKHMDEFNAERAMVAPEAFRSMHAEEIIPVQGILTLTLSAYAVVRIDGPAETEQR